MSICTPMGAYCSVTAVHALHVYTCSLFITASTKMTKREISVNKLFLKEVKLTRFPLLTCCPQIAQGLSHGLLSVLCRSPLRCYASQSAAAGGPL